MQAVSANDLKTRAVGAIAEALQQQSELEVALSETRADLAAERIETMSTMEEDNETT